MNTGAKLKVSPAIFDTLEKQYGAFADLLCRAAISPGNDSPGLRERIRAISCCSQETAIMNFKACDRFDVIEKLGAVRLPVLVISGSDDRLTPSEFSDFLAQAIPGADHCRIADAGHLSPLEKPEEVCSAVQKFLAGLA